MQRRISAKYESEAYSCLEAVVGQEALRRTVESLPADSILIKLRIPLTKGTDPDDTYCETPYARVTPQKSINRILAYFQHIGVDTKRGTRSSSIYRLRSAATSCLTLFLRLTSFCLCGGGCLFYSCICIFLNKIAQSYVAKFARKSLVGEEMLAYFLEYFPHLQHLEHREG